MELQGEDDGEHVCGEACDFLEDKETSSIMPRVKYSLGMTVCAFVSNFFQDWVILFSQLGAMIASYGEKDVNKRENKEMRATINFLEEEPDVT